MPVGDNRGDFEQGAEEPEEGWKDLDDLGRPEPSGEDEDGSTSISGEPEQPLQPSEPEKKEPAEPVEFDQRHRDEFEGLLYLGKLTDEFTIYGHTFVIRTLTVDDVLEISLLHKKYIGSLGDVRAYQTAVTAAVLVSVDGQPLPLPISDRPDDTMLINRFNFVKRYYPPTVDAVYQRSLLLEQKVQEVLVAMGKV